MCTISPGASPTYFDPFLADDMGAEYNRDHHVEQVHGERNGESIPVTAAIDNFDVHVHVHIVSSTE